MQNPPPPTMPQELPTSFFEGLPEGVAPPQGLPRGNGTTSTLPTGPMKALMLYDCIIDDVLTHPGEQLKDTAKRLGKSPGTISLVVRSDFFKARWLQRRQQFNEEMNFRLMQKMGKVAEKSLDLTLKSMELRGESIPLPQLDSINKNILDRLGYGPTAGGASVAVQINNTQTAAPVPSASVEGLARAREYLKKLETVNAASGVVPGPQPASRDAGVAGAVVEGEATRIGETT